MEGRRLMNYVTQDPALFSACVSESVYNPAL